MADASDAESPIARRGKFDGAICCEVLEHVDDPGSLLRGLGARIEPGAPAFVSTVANMEAEDHVYLFHYEDGIRSLVRGNGFAIETDQPLVLAGAQEMDPKPLNYSAIVRR